MRVPIVVCPTSETDLESMMDMFFDACLLDWKNKRKNGAR